MRPNLCFCAVQFNINGNDLRIEGGKTLADCLESNTTITRVRCEYICAGKQHIAPEAESAVQLHVLQSHMSGFFSSASGCNHAVATTLSTMCIPLAWCYTQFTICSLLFGYFVILTRCVVHDRWLDCDVGRYPWLDLVMAHRSKHQVVEWALRVPRPLEMSFASTRRCSI